MIQLKRIILERLGCSQAVLWSPGLFKKYSCMGSETLQKTCIVATCKVALVAIITTGGLQSGDADWSHKNDVSLCGQSDSTLRHCPSHTSTTCCLSCSSLPDTVLFNVGRLTGPRTVGLCYRGEKEWRSIQTDAGKDVISDAGRDEQILYLMNKLLATNEEFIYFFLNLETFYSSKNLERKKKWP